MADDTKLGGAVDAGEDRTAIQKDWGRLENGQGPREGKCGVLPLGWDKPMCQCKVGVTDRRPALQEGTWWVLMGQDVWGPQHTMYGEMWRELHLSSLERKRQRGGLAAVCKSQMGGHREDRDRLFSEEHSERQQET